MPPQKATVLPLCLLLLLIPYGSCTARDPQPQTQSATQPVSVCTLEAGSNRAVVGVLDGETLKLDDGTEVRLIGVLSPRSPDSALDMTFWPPALEARAALEQLVLGRSVELAFSGRRSDRYGRILAHVFVEVAGERIWVQARLLSTGHARAYVLGDGVACTLELMAHEALARHSALGLWPHAAYQVRSANNTAELMRLRSTYQIVQGDVISVVQTKSVQLLHFGPDRLRDFTLAIKPQQKRQLESMGHSLAGLEGRRLQVRGWIERRSGPTIDVIDASQIEVEAKGAPVVEQSPARPRTSRRSRARSAVPAVAEDSLPGPVAP